MDSAEPPDDGHRYELIDGTLIVAPSPAVAPQRIVGSEVATVETPFPLTLSPSGLVR